MANTINPADDNNWNKLLLAGLEDDPEILAKRKQIEELQAAFKATTNAKIEEARQKLLKVQQTQKEIEFATKTKQKTKPKNQFVEEKGINLEEIQKPKYSEPTFESHKKFNQSGHRFDAEGKVRCYYNTLNKCSKVDNPGECKFSHYRSTLIMTSYYKTLNNKEHNKMALFMAEHVGTTSDDDDIDVGTTSDDHDTDPHPVKVVKFDPVPHFASAADIRRSIQHTKRRPKSKWNKNKKRRSIHRSISSTAIPPTISPTAISPISTLPSINPTLITPTSTTPTATNPTSTTPTDPIPVHLFLAAMNNNNVRPIAY